VSRGTLLAMLGIFLGGATPWLEAIVVVPVGIVAGLPPVAVVVAGATGNLLTVWVAAHFGARIRAWWRRRRGRPHGRDEDDGPAPVPDDADRDPGRTVRVFRRWGLAGLALIGPVGLGTQISAAVAVGFGVGPRTAFVWIGAGTMLWCVLAAVLASLGLTIAGVGA
jgi:hypothetical protein